MLKSLLIAGAVIGALESAFSGWVIWRWHGGEMRSGFSLAAHGIIVEDLPELIITGILLFVHVLAVVFLPLMARRAMIACAGGGGAFAKVLASFVRLSFYMALLTALITFPNTTGSLPHALALPWWVLRAAVTVGMPVAMLAFMKWSPAAVRCYGESFVSQMGDSAMASVTRDGAALVMLMLGALVLVVFVAAVPSMKTFGFSFLTSSEWRPNSLPGGPKHDAQGNTFIDPDTGETAMEPDKPPAFGALPVIYGTSVSSAIAVVLAVPLSFGAAIFLVRVAPRALVPPVSFLIEFLAAIPSIAYGIWGLFVLGPFLQTRFEPIFYKTYLKLPATTWPQLGLMILLPVLIQVAGWLWVRALGRRPKGSVSAMMVRLIVAGTFLSAVLGLIVALSLAYSGARVLPGLDASVRKLTGISPSLSWLFNYTIERDGQPEVHPVALTGYDMLCGGLILAIMIIPIITAISRDVLRAVPRAQTEGTTALGATWWQSSKEMLKYSRSGLFGAVMLGLARAAGETMAVTMVIGNNPQIKLSPFVAAQTMSSLLATQFAEADQAGYRSALFEVALILLVMSLVFNIVARYLVVGKGSRSAAAA
jgi:ABC-type phosphate transport system permease subunit